MDKAYRLLTLVLSLSLSAIWTVSAAEKTYTFSVVPQQSAIKTAKIWGPILRRLSTETGVYFKLQTNKDIPTFEQHLQQGEYDFSYMNPYHYTVFHNAQGYEAIARAKDKRIQGIVVVRKDSPTQDLQELNNQKLAFPSPAAFAASILPRSYMKQQGINITPDYVSSHDSVYLNVAKGRHLAGGGVVRTFDNFQPVLKNELKILWRTPKYTPHAIAAHPRVPQNVVLAVQETLLSLDQSESGQVLLQTLKVKGFEAGKDADWDDVRALNIQELDE